MKTQSILFIVLIVVVFYVLFMLPQRRQQKNRQTMMNKLGPGAKVLTSGGIYGEIVSVEGDVLLVRIAEDVEIELDQRAIIRVVEEAPLTDITEDEDGEEFGDDEENEGFSHVDDEESQSAPPRS
ncbi:preprotein translocase subunit YajC [Alicyclobacillus sp. ALC3]|uniref:preprotein translocase subunit YajC n=1 Tax=Alicyclobacillus sp. ALC3 TaxID=2796143 RepID=UPI002379A1F7|nr:preprotein translocase subunit YajC [Alicyclobacillus sp. ALC3]WDL96183.1 preprotein translocase subunit YajC [Alicyclobacillus sp. ALC3]